MACFVSVSFSVPLFSLQNPIKGRYPKKSAFCRLPGLKTTKTASHVLPPCSSNKGIFSVSGQCYLTTMSRHFDEIVSCSLNAHCNLQQCCTCLAELLKLTWTIHDPLAFCPGKWAHQVQLQSQIALINRHSLLPKFQLVLNDKGCWLSGYEAQYRNSMVGVSVSSFILKSFYQENVT